MLQTWNKFCFTTGYVEVSATFPGPDQNTQGYVSFFSFSFHVGVWFFGIGGFGCWSLVFLGFGFVMFVCSSGFWFLVFALLLVVRFFRASIFQAPFLRPQRAQGCANARSQRGTS